LSVPNRRIASSYVIRGIGVLRSWPASRHSATRISSDSAMMSSWSMKLISMSSWVNSGCRSARKSSSR
jgi:hypothetical protein